MITFFFTEANVFKLNGNIYSIDDTCKINKNDIVNAVNNGDNVIIKINSSFLVAVIIPKNVIDNKIENLTIKIIVSNNEKEIISSNVNVHDYQKTKDLHGISLVDEIISELLLTIETK